MEHLWREPPKTITRLTAELAAETGWTKHTVISFLNRMEKKGAVRYEEGAKARAYWPKIGREEAVLEETESFLGRVFGGRVGLMVSSMVESKALSDADIRELMDILEQAAGGGRDD